MCESNSVHVSLPDAAATRALGAAFARTLRSAPAESFVIYFEGELGAGKTTLVGGLLAELGVRGAVRSPTYTLVEPYEFAADRVLHHIDLYRLATPDEVDALGLRDLLAHAGILLIEWPSKGEGRVPQPDALVRLAYDQGGARRQAALTALTSKGGRLLADFVGVTEQ
jgi:tRNA threonylcarbamoyladenosine biosynthesis protein TsaE